jgi:hypothetical protein
MELKDIASVSGKGGLFKVVAPTKTGVILETLDDAKQRIVASNQQRISLLHEISIYTTTQEGTVPLQTVLQKINTLFGADIGIDAEAEGTELRAFLKSVLPEYDESRVYTSDIRKLVKWYGILRQHAPALLQAEA